MGRGICYSLRSLGLVCGCGCDQILDQDYFAEFVEMDGFPWILRVWRCEMYFGEVEYKRGLDEV